MGPRAETNAYCKDRRTHTTTLAALLGVNFRQWQCHEKILLSNTSTLLNKNLGNLTQGVSLSILALFFFRDSTRHLLVSSHLVGTSDWGVAVRTRSNEVQVSSTPLNITMEHNNECLEDDFPWQMGWFSGSMLIFPDAACEWFFLLRNVF